ncbi:hypothetical protein Syun_002818 [Stephania yunnanensis]|uniref:glutathione transferase n=1 Tax=Stephania yunnanensis TaxID=152371 RepID=A0AAP0L048_9MAGN
MASSQSESQDSQQPPSGLQLYSYWRSSCSFRVRIALNLKGLDYEYKAVNLLKGSNSVPVHFSKLNPISYVPVLVDGDIVLADSFAIILYLEEKYPQHPLLPLDPQKKAINIQAASIVSSSIQPLQNIGVLKYVEDKVSSEEKIAWAQNHIGKGFTGIGSHGDYSAFIIVLDVSVSALEKLLHRYAGKYATGDEVLLADLFLAPQIHASITRFNLDMAQFPLLSRLHEAYNLLPAFQAASPERQPDYLKP